MADRHTKGDLQQMQSLPLRIKITMTERRIFDWYNHFQGDVYLSFSGGKDSTVLKHIIDNMGLQIPSLFVNTGLEFPEIQKFAMSQENVTTIRPEMRFDEVIKKYGYPVVSKEVSKCVYYARHGKGKQDIHYQKLFGEFYYNGELSKLYNHKKWSFLYDAPFEVGSQCCDVMKKRTVHKYQKETGRVPITATMAEESLLREQAWIKTGCNSFNPRNSISKPMSFWTEQDVLHYIKQFNVPYCSVYGDIVTKEPDDTPDGQMSFADVNGVYEESDILKTTGMKRTGCMFCMFGCHLEKEPNRFQMMKKDHPRQYEYCIRGGQMVDGKWMPDQKGLGLGYVLDYIGVKYE